jgi:small subunit ribosomal protein S17
MTFERKRVMTGRVFKDKMDKSVIVEVRRRVADRQYGKIVTKRARYAAHDEKNECRVGDIVEIRESRPLSRTKRWVVTRVVERAVEV